MKKRIFAAVLATLFCVLAIAPLTVSAEEAAAEKKLPAGLTIACVGDSITYGSGSAATDADPTSVVKDDKMNYPGQLAALIGGESKITGGGNGTTNVIFKNDSVTIYNDGKASTAVLNDPIAGAEFAQGAMKVPTLMTSFDRADLDIVILMLGTNDSKITDYRYDKADKKYEQGNWDTRFATHDPDAGDILDDEGNVVVMPTPAQEFEARYRAMLQKYFDMNSKPYVYCMLPIPCASEGYEEDKNYSKSYRISDKNMRDEINPLITSIVEDLQEEGMPIGLIDMRAAFPDPTTPEGLEELKTLLVDEVHPNPAGYTVMAETVYERLLADTYSLNYIVEDADEGARIPQNKTLFGETTITLPETRGKLTKNGAALTGWSTEPNGQGTVYAEGATVEFADGVSQIDLYPVWGNAGGAASGSISMPLIIGIAGGVVVLALFAVGFVVLKKNKKA